MEVVEVFTESLHPVLLIFLVLAACDGNVMSAISFMYALVTIQLINSFRYCSECLFTSTPTISKFFNLDVSAPFFFYFFDCLGPDMEFSFESSFGCYSFCWFCCDPLILFLSYLLRLCLTTNGNFAKSDFSAWVCSGAWAASIAGVAFGFSYEAKMGGCFWRRLLTNSKF